MTTLAWWTLNLRIGEEGPRLPGPGAFVSGVLGNKVPGGWYTFLITTRKCSSCGLFLHIQSSSLEKTLFKSVFFFFRYPQKVMDKILSMAEGIKVTDAPIHTTRDELVAKVKKRGISSSNG